MPVIFYCKENGKELWLYAVLIYSSDSKDISVSLSGMKRVLMVKSYTEFILIWTLFKCQGGAQKKNTRLSWKKTKTKTKQKQKNKKKRGAWF